MATVAVQASQPVTSLDQVADLNPSEDSKDVRVIDLALPEATAARDVLQACLENGFFYGGLRVTCLARIAADRLVGSLLTPLLVWNSQEP